MMAESDADVEDEVSIEFMKRSICCSVQRFEYNDRDTLMQFLAKHLRDKNIVKEEIMLVGFGGGNGREGPLLSGDRKMLNFIYS